MNPKVLFRKNLHEKIKMCVQMAPGFFNNLLVSVNCFIDKFLKIRNLDNLANILNIPWVCIGVLYLITRIIEY